MHGLQGKQPLGKLLTAEGVEMLKNVCLENLHLTANDEENDEVFTKLVQEMREVSILALSIFIFLLGAFTIDSITKKHIFCVHLFFN